MKNIRLFFEGFSNALLTLYQFIISFFKDFISLIKILSRLPSTLESVFAWIPGELLALLMLLFSCVILYKILGREG